MENPFVLLPYVSKELFCDREQELELLLGYIQNHNNVTMISPRRLGKTGLIFRFFDEIKSRKLPFKTVYVDISSSQGIDDFNTLLAESIISAYPPSISKQIFSAVAGLRPIVAFDAVTGQPQVSLKYMTDDEKKHTIKDILYQLENSGEKVVVAIDEFQQIREYPDVNMEAVLRTYIQPLKNVSFIFCGSKKHIMTDMFSNAKNPFYDSTTFLFLHKLDREVYSQFIKTKFSDARMSVTDDAMNFILDWTCSHTFYTQTLCNRIFSSGNKNVDIDLTKAKASEILEFNKERFYEIMRLLTPKQWQFLKAVAKEGELMQPTASDFLTKYQLGASASVLRIIESLKDKELLLEENNESGTKYSVYNVFLMRFLQSI